VNSIYKRVMARKISINSRVILYVLQVNFCPYRRQNIDRFSNLFTGITFCGKFVIKWLLHHTLIALATLPCEIQLFKNHYNHNKYVCKKLIL